MSTELEDRLTAATTTPSRPLDIDATIAAGLRARRRRAIVRVAATTTSVAAIIAAAVVVIGPRPAVPPIDPPAVSAEESTTVGEQEPPTTDAPAARDGQASLSPSAEDVDGPLDFDVYGIVPPQGWQLSSAGTADGTYAAALGQVWFHAQWTPSGADTAAEHGDRLDLRQTDTTTVEEQLGFHLEQAAWRPVELDQLTVYVFGDEPLVRWELGDTYLEMSGQGLSQDDLLAVVPSAQQLDDTPNR